MMENIKNNEFQERQNYVPVRAKVMEVTAQKVICTSPGPSASFNNYDDGGSF